MFESLEVWLSGFLREAGAIAGTIHLWEQGGLRLRAAVNIPAPVQEIVAWVPSGKGMAGQALERGEPVTTCNLQDDPSGSVRPGAKAVNAQAAIALPVRDSAGAIIAVLGAAFAGEREIGSAEMHRLGELARGIEKALD